MYDLLLTHRAQRFYEQADAPLARRLNRCFEQLRKNPTEHPNIKRLKGSLSGCLRYRVGDWRVIYEINETERSVTILLVVHRSSAYQD
jgi:mRNA interferase RelE/StbE